MKKHFLVLLILVAQVASAEEVDDFKNPAKVPRDATEKLNEFINGHMQEFAELTKLKSCDRKEIRGAVMYAFDQNFTEIGNKMRSSARSAARGQSAKGTKSAAAEIEYFGETSTESSIYTGADVYCCIQRLNIGGIYVGIDKVDHFFGNGGMLWEKYDQQVIKNEKKILEMNVNQENGGWGLQGGVKSYGDLAANWQGLRFYKNLFDGRDPYMSCKDGKVTVLRKFDISEYIDPLWNESVNCSAYPTKASATKVAANLKALGMTCPNVPSDCQKMIEKYKADPLLSSAIISPGCLNKVKVEDSVEKTSDLDWEQVTGIIGKGKLKDIGIVWEAMRGKNQAPSKGAQ